MNGSESGGWKTWNGVYPWTWDLLKPRGCLGDAEDACVVEVLVNPKVRLQHMQHALYVHNISLFSLAMALIDSLDFVTKPRQLSSRQQLEICV